VIYIHTYIYIQDHTEPTLIFSHLLGGTIAIAIGRIAIGIAIGIVTVTVTVTVITEKIQW